MGRTRLEAFSDGVIAIIITIMVLELKIPHGSDFHALLELTPKFLSYVLSFVNVAIYWSNHHHLIHTVDRVDGRILWANNHLLFWLSLFPFTTGWMGENHFATWPVIVYGINLLMAGVAYSILVRCIIGIHGKESDIARAIGSDFKGNISVAAYAVAIAIAFYNPWISGGLFVAVALIWFIPDRRIEKVINN